MSLLLFLLLSDPRIATDAAYPDVDPLRRLGELTHVDHVNRTLVLRPDRLGTEPKDRWDLPHAIRLLPYALVRQHGATATLSDLPLGTHLHAELFLGERGEYALPKYRFPQKPRVGFHSPFDQAARLSDDISVDLARRVRWRVESVAQPPIESGGRGSIGIIEATCIRDGHPVEEARQGSTAFVGRHRFSFDESTVVWTGSTAQSWRVLRKGQEILANLTRSTLLASDGDANVKSTAMLTTVLADEPAIEAATERQRLRHIARMRIDGVPCRVLSTEMIPGKGAAGFVDLAPYPGLDEQLISEIEEAGSARLWGAERSLRTYENDAKNLRIVRFERVDPATNPAHLASVRVRLRGNELLEGYRQGRTVLLSVSEWSTPERPRETRLWPRDVREIHVTPATLPGRSATSADVEP